MNLKPNFLLSFLSFCCLLLVLHLPSVLAGWALGLHPAGAGQETGRGLREVLKRDLQP